MQVASVGIDLGKTTFHLVALDDHGKIVIKKKFSRKQLLAYTANLQPALVGIEACSGAHFIGAALKVSGRSGVRAQTSSKNHGAVAVILIILDQPPAEPCTGSSNPAARTGVNRLTMAVIAKLTHRPMNPAFSP